MPTCPECGCHFRVPDGDSAEEHGCPRGCVPAEPCLFGRRCLYHGERHDGEDCVEVPDDDEDEPMLSTVTFTDADLADDRLKLGVVQDEGRRLASIDANNVSLLIGEGVLESALAKLRQEPLKPAV